METEDNKLKIDGEILTDEEWDDLAVITDDDINQSLEEFDLAVPEKFKGMLE